MKGVSSIIVLVLLVLIAIGLASIAYGFYTGYFEFLFEGVEQGANRSQEIMGSEMTLMGINFDAQTVIVRNTGKSELSGFAVFINELPAEADMPTSIIAGEVGVFDFSSYTNFDHGDTIKITTSHAAVETSIP
jgi:FlaG/FlaF family flagellin (archaellin)